MRFSFYTTGPLKQQPLNADYNMAGVIAGSIIGTLLLTLLIGGLVLTVLYRHGFRFGNVLKGILSNLFFTSTRNPEIEELENIGYSSLDQINSPAHFSSMDTETSKNQHYTQLKIYENTNVEPKAETSTYEDMTEAAPASYESISSSPYQNSDAQPKGRGNGVTAARYIDQVLRPHAIPHTPINHKFKHDNARAHTAGATIDFLQQNGIGTMQLPALSSDLNPIEHLLDEIQRRVNEPFCLL
ncbi:uncharacterized protein [Haliotis cracherodii]|uniref:uncharacterized protein n=1 Tax=Haliotis cracherodii TaxID=6455 RepID=UPI0039ECB3CD